TVVGRIQQDLLDGAVQEAEAGGLVGRGDVGPGPFAPAQTGGRPGEGVRRDDVDIELRPGAGRGVLRYPVGVAGHVVLGAGKDQHAVDPGAAEVDPALAADADGRDTDRPTLLGRDVGRRQVGDGGGPPGDGDLHALTPAV